MSTRLFSSASRATATAGGPGDVVWDEPQPRQRAELNGQPQAVCRGV
jgi:hypothetical protein